MDLHELVGRRVLPVEGRHVGVADPRQSPVRRFDLLTGSAGRDAEGIIERRARRHSTRAEIRRRFFLRCGMGSRGKGVYRTESDTRRRRTRRSVGNDYGGEKG